MTASAIIAEVAAPVMGLPVFITGSLVAEETYGLSNAHDDADLFCRTRETLIAAAQRFQHAGFELGDRDRMAWDRWMRYGFGRWHTNSIKLTSPTTKTEVNLVYKLQGGNPVDSLAATIESFDFGLLATGYDLTDTDVLTKRDMRAYLYPDHDPNGPLPLLPNKRSNWRRGQFSQYNGLREVGRYGKYLNYGYDMSLVKEDMLLGYRESSIYHLNHFDEDKRLLGQIYTKIADAIEDDLADDMVETYKEMLHKDELDEIMEMLE